MVSGDNLYWMLRVLGSHSIDRIRVYVNSVEPSAVNYVDMKSIEHPCSKAGERAFEGLRSLPAWSNGLLSEEEKKTVSLVEHFSKENRLEFEVIDLAQSGFTAKIRFLLKRWKTPTVAFKDRTIVGFPSKTELEALLRK